jgi:hypothetical protein
MLNFTNIFFSGFVSVAYRQDDRYMLVHVLCTKNGTKFHRAGHVFMCSEFILNILSSQMVGGGSQLPVTSVSNVRVAACP